MKPFSCIIVSTCLLIASCETARQKKDRVAPAPIPLPEAEPVRAPAAISNSVDSSGVVTTPTGLRYKVLQSGAATGRSPTMFDTVMVHYRGTLTDGTVFDSSYDRGSPATFGVGQVIPGWTEALRLMKPGDKWLLQIPSHLAYGSRSVGAKIPPNSDLIFQVELLQVIGGL
jgi:FKBP-type peptidyl-prolyl cis-trans isomerase FklB